MIDDLKFVMGGPCKLGHDGLRYRKGGACVHCSRVKNNKPIGDEGRKAYAKKWRTENPDQQRANHLSWARRNSGKVNSTVAQRDADKMKATPGWANKDIIKAIYDACPKGCQVDHIVPIRSDLVCGLHVEFNLQHLTISENASKSNRWWPDMPE